MAKKIAKKPIKTIIAKVPKIPNFDLSFEKTDENTKIIVALENLKASGGWQFLTQVFEKNIEYIGNQIITKLGDDGKPITEDQVDRLRDRYSYLKELLAKPDHFLKILRADTKKESRDEHDPYYQAGEL